MEGRNGSVGKATHKRLDGPGFEPRWGEILRTRPDRCRGPPSLLYVGCRISFLGVKRPGRDVDHPPCLAFRYPVWAELCPLSLLGMLRDSL